MLEGQYIGWIYFFKPDWSKLFTLKIWRDAVSQVVFSAGLGMHAVTLFASHKQKNEKILLPSICIPVLNFVTSIFAAITLFSIIGHASYETGVKIENMPIEGLELAFVAYPALLSTFPIPQFWTALFFFMLILIGLSTQFAFVDITCTFIEGMFFRFGYINVSKAILEISLIVTILVIDIGILATSAGYYWVDLLDHYVVGLNLIVVLLLQTLILGHVLSFENIEARLAIHGEDCPHMYKILYKYITPVVLLLLVIMGLIDEIKNPIDLPFLGKVLAFTVFFIPTSL